MSKESDKVISDAFLSGVGAEMSPDGKTVAVGPDWALPVVYPTKRKVGQHSFSKEEAMDEEEEKPNAKVRAALIEKPVENSGPVPLIPNLDANARHVIVSIRVHKRTPPQDGIKGDVPESTTPDFVARRWGDGIYDFEALNEAGQVLRRNTNVKLAYGYQPPMEGTGQVNPLLGKLVAGASDNGVSDKLFERLEKESVRAHEASASAVESARKLSSDYASMIREDSKERSEKDRAYHKAQTEQQGNFFQTMLVSVQTMHEQAMERSREQFQQTMQMMQMSHQQTMSQNNPALLFQLFERGLKMGMEGGGDGADESPLASILGAATHGLSTVKEMMQLQNQQPAGILPASAPARASKERQNPEKKPAISREDMLEVIRLKKIAESKGLDFSGLVKQAQAMVSNMPVEQETEEEEPEDDESGEESDAESAGSADVD